MIETLPNEAVTRVVLIEDHLAVRELLRAELTRRAADRFAVVGDSSDAAKAVEICRDSRADLLVTDLIMPGAMSGLQAVRQVTAALPGTRVLVFSGCTQRPLIAQAIAAGAAGFVRKMQPLAVVLRAMREIRAGGRYFDADARPLDDAMPLSALTSREREVAQLVASGKSTKETAAALGVSVKTADKHRARMMNKLDVHNAVAVTHFAIAAGLVPVG